MTANYIGTTEAEARAEAQRILTYWHNLGYTQIRTTVSSYGFRKGREYICGWTVKSNLDKYGNPVGPRTINLKENQ